MYGAHRYKKSKNRDVPGRGADHRIVTIWTYIAEDWNDIRLRHSFIWRKPLARRDLISYNSILLEDVPGVVPCGLKNPKKQLRDGAGSPRVAKRHATANAHILGIGRYDAIGSLAQRRVSARHWRVLVTVRENILKEKK